MDVEFSHLLRRKLEQCRVRKLDHSPDGEAAVLIPLFEKNGRPHLLLTLRTRDVATHKGQVSFPGGVWEEQDASLEETALRESEEEIGLLPDWVDVLGPFHQYVSGTNLLVTPYVGVLNTDFSLSTNPDEVERILEVPLDFFRQTEPRSRSYRRLGRRGTHYYYDFEGESIWGLTAAMIRDFLKLVDA